MMENANINDSDRVRFAANINIDVEDYWLYKLSGELVKSGFLYDYPSSGPNEYRIERLTFRLTGWLYSRLMDLCRGSYPRLHMILIGGVNGLLSKYTGNEDIIVGTSIYKQEIDAEFINTVLVIRNQLTGNMTFKELLLQIRKTVIAAEENQNFPLELLLQKLKISFSKNDDFPLFDVAILLENIQDKNYIQYIKPNVLFCFLETGEYLEGVVEYNAARYKKESIERIVIHFKHLLEVVLLNVDIQVQHIDLLEAEEKKRLLLDLNGTGTKYPQTKTIHTLFAEQMDRAPDKIALVGSWQLTVGKKEETSELTQITYRELNNKSDQLAYELKGRGINPDTIVGIMMERSMALVIGIMGILKSSGAYLPIDPQYPAERINYLLTDSGAKVLVSSSTLVNEVEKLSRWDVEKLILEVGNRYACPTNHLHLQPAPATSLAYVIYTSGTTGKPKGVMINHQSLVNYIWWAAQIYVGNEKADFPLYTSVSFDLTVTSIFTPLITGNALVVYEGDDKETLIEKIIDENKVGIVKATPSHLKLIQYKKVKNSIIKRFIVGGEELGTQLARNIIDNFKPTVEIYNEYGPTEATIGCMIYKFTGKNDARKSVPLGIPINNTQIYILDKNLQLLPSGIAGEIYISGDGVARGYLNRPGLTAEKFVPVTSIDHRCGDINKKFCQEAVFQKHPPDGRRRPSARGPDKRIYKTGDLARWLSDGNIEFSGRLDHQVKIRGFRVELGELEYTLLKHRQIKNVLVTVKERKPKGQDYQKEKYICAYVVLHPDLEPARNRKKINLPDLKLYLTSHLPGYMIPSFFIPLDRIPLTANGKVDKNSLPEPDLKGVVEYAAPRNNIEEKLVELWSEVLEIDKEVIGIDSNFFDLGGHSLSAIILISKIQQRFQANISLAEMFRNSTIRALSNHIKGIPRDDYICLELFEKKDYYALSTAQKRLFILHQLNPLSINYNLPLALILEGKVEKEKIETCFRELIVRHESLRTSFRMLARQPVQRVQDNLEFKIKHDPVAGNIQVQVDKFICPFDLGDAPLLRVKLMEIDNETQILVVDMHHIITDGISRDILAREFTVLYAGNQLSPLKLQYKDFSQWQNSRKESKVLAPQEAYWLKEFRGEIPILNLPLDYQRPTIQDFAGKTIAFEISNEKTSGIRYFAQQQGVTLFMVVLTIYYVLLAKISHQQDIVVGTDIAGRRHPDLESIIGMFVNTLALRNYPQTGKTFTWFLSEVKQKDLQAFENQDYPFEDLVDKVKVQRDASRNPVFDVMFAFQNRGMMAKELTSEEKIPGLNSKPFPMENRTAKFDLTLNILEKEEQLICSFEYSTRLFKPITIERFIMFFKEILSSVLHHPDQKISAVQIISAAEKQRILFRFNNTGTDVKNRHYYCLFEEQAEKTPGRTAAVYKDQRISYGELNNKTNRIAYWLLKHGVTPGSIVAVYLSRDIELLASILGVFKAGAAYLPIQEDYPPERVKNILEDSAVRIMISKENNREIAENIQISLPCLQEIICLEQVKNLEDKQQILTPLPPRIDHGTGNLAYIIYTSGSTGKPKGVMIHQPGMINHLYAKINDLLITSQDVIAQTASVSFDISIWQFLSGLLVGGGCFIIDRAVVIEPELLLQKLQAGKITILELVPSLMKAFLGVVDTIKQQKHIQLKHLRWMVATGEALNVSLVREWYKYYPGIKLVNAYGPTEASDDITHHVVHQVPGEFQKNIMIGKPLQNIHVYILDRNLNLCPTGVRGEICAAGVGIGSGYLNDIEKTSQCFIPNPFFEEIDDEYYAVLYKTGDIGCFREDGSIEYLDRLDSQVKIRGYRIELGEIENRLLQNDAIYEAAVVVKIKDKKDKYLCAYVVLNSGYEESFDVPQLKEYLAEGLPGYMIPSHIIKLDKLPVTPNGKIDRKLLLESTVNMPGSVYIGPRNEIEEKLVEAWSEILGIDKQVIGIGSNFFELGGHSLNAALLTAQIHKIFNVKVPLVEIFKRLEIKKLAKYIQGLAQDRYHPIELVEKKEYYGLSSAQKRLYTLQHMDPTGTSYNMPEMAVFKDRPDIERLEQNFRKLIRRHESLRTSFEIMDGEPVQRIKDDMAFEIEFYFIGQEAQGAGRMEMFVRPFDLSQVPLLRVGLLQSQEGKYLLLIDMHHIISDGVSHDILVRDFAALDDGRELPPLRLQYKDYSEWQASEKQKEIIKEQQEYWLKQFQTGIPVLALPQDYTRPPTLTIMGNKVSFQLNQEETRDLYTLAKQEDATLFMVLLTIYNILLMKISGQEDIVVGIPIEGRIHADLRRIIGMFVNMLALRHFPSPSKSFKEFLKEVKENTIRAFENQEYPFEELVQQVVKKRDTRKYPIFNVTFALEVQDRGMQTGEVLQGLFDLEQEAYKDIHKNSASKFDLDLLGIETQKGLYFTVDYNVKLFNEETIKAFIDYFRKILSIVSENPGKKIEEIEIISEEKMNRMKKNIQKDQEEVMIEFNI